ncbi:MAG: 4'-phosphopantetheinyl transferase superfamily protein [Cyanobacteria bacterium P01_F01_bin.150]
MHPMLSHAITIPFIQLDISLGSSHFLPPLTADEVHIWRSPLETSPTLLAQLHAYLSEDEQARAARFRFDHHRHYFIVGRGILRVLLGQYMHQHPQNIVFEYGDRGKPQLADSTVRDQDFRSQGSQRTLGSGLEFNVSHSGGVALYAIALDRRVGIDLEKLRPMADAAQLAQRFFTEQEYQQLLAQPTDQQELAFFRGWTRKEAYLKATGEGLGGLETVEVSLLEEQPSILETLADHNAASTASLKVTSANANTAKTIRAKTVWFINDISMKTNHRAAVVIEAKDCKPNQLSKRFFELELPNS